MVPRSAVLMTGSTSLVYVETELGRFEIRPVKLGHLLDDGAVILDGLKEGDKVAVSGNFLIDSQMQLAGKPSLIDPTRALVREAPEEQGPLKIAADQSKPISGEVGKLIERLYRSYFVLVEALAADQVPSEDAVQAVEQTAKRLSVEDPLPEPLRKYAANIAEESAHLHHLPLEEGRKQFKSISANILQLAAAVRGEEAKSPLIHFYCSMVPNGGGDWLQSTAPPSNPYWGSKMLRCAQHEQELKPPDLASR